MARMATVAGTARQQTLKKHFEQETVPELKKQIDALIEKIGYVNLVALLGAINGMTVADVSTPYSDKDYRNNWFALKGENKRGCKGDGVKCAGGVEVLVDDKLKWRERWVDIYGELIFGAK